MKNRKNFNIGSWITIPSEIVVEIISKYNFDFNVIDLEHSSINLYQVENLLRIIKLHNQKVYIRTINNDEFQIKRILDYGADGIILPNIRNLNQLNKICKMIYYPPKGNRGVGLSRSSMYGKNFANYFKKFNKNIKIIIIIENIEALKHLDEIFASKLYSSVMIGPYDLSASLNIPGKFENQKYKNALKLIISKAKYYQKKIGIHLVEPDPTKIKKLSKIYDFIIYSLDTKLLIKALDEIKEIRNN